MQVPDILSADTYVSMHDALNLYVRRMKVVPPPTLAQRDELAGMIGRLVPLYAPSYDSTGPRLLSIAEIALGRFFGGGRDFVFKDGREPIRGVMTTRDALNAAMELMKSVA